MKKIAGYGLVFLLVFLTSLVVYLPAQVVVRQFPLPPQLQLAGVQGSLWQGSAEQVTWQNRNFGDVSWDLHSLALLQAKIEAAVRFGRGSALNLRGKGVVGYGISGLYARDLVVSLPAEMALSQVKIPLPVSAQGQFELSVKDYSYQAPYCLSAQGTLAWSSAEITSPFGSVGLDQAIADINCAESSVTLKGNQNSNQASSEFTITLSPNNSYQAEGWFKPGDEFPEKLSSQLKWLPKPDNQGRYSFKQQGRL